MASKHGGARKGAGKPAQFDKPMKRKEVMLPDEAIQFFLALGNGNLSAGVRQAWRSLTKHVKEVNSMGYYAKNPYEQPEPPRCQSCDEFLEKVGSNISFRWECRNPACEECPPKYQVVECSTCGEEYTYGEFCRNCTDGASHDLDISTNTYKELVEIREKQARLTKRAPDAPNWVCRNCEAENPPINTNCFNCNGTARR